MPPDPMPAHPSTFIGDYLPYLLAKASHEISSEFHKEVLAAGVSVMEWRVMASLANGQAKGVNALCATCLTKQPTMTKLVARMIDKGWLARSAHASDRRQSLLRLTPAGDGVLAPLLDAAKRHEAQVLKDFAASQASELKARLLQMIAAKSG